MAVKKFLDLSGVSTLLDQLKNIFVKTDDTTNTISSTNGSKIPTSQAVIDYVEENGGGGNKDVLAGKRILMCGDSLMYGLGWAGGFKNCLTEKHPTATITNVAVNGATISQTSQDWIALQLASNCADKDIIIFDGGFNDLGEEIPIGDIPENIGYIEGATTITQYFSTVLYQIRTVNPQADVFYIIPILYQGSQVGNISTKQQNTLADSLKTIAGYYGVGIIDLRHCATVFTITPINSTNNPYMYDSLHYNEAGYRKVAPYIDHEICKYYNT